jgi:hypothetical protein
MHAHHTNSIYIGNEGITPAVDTENDTIVIGEQGVQQRTYRKVNAMMLNEVQGLSREHERQQEEIDDLAERLRGLESLVGTARLAKED